MKRLGAVLDRHRAEHPWHVAAIRLLTLTGARLSEMLNLQWDEIGELSKDGGSPRLHDSKAGPRTIWLGPEAARLVAALPHPEGAERVFPEDLTSARLYTFWCGIREEAGLPGLRIHDCRHTWASQGIMNGVGLTTVGRLLGHRKRRTTAIYAHLDDAALQDVAAQAAGVIAEAMGYKLDPPPMPGVPEDGPAGTRPVEPLAGAVSPKPAPTQDTPGDTAHSRTPDQPLEPVRHDRKTLASSVAWSNGKPAETPSGTDMRKLSPKPSGVPAASISDTRCPAGLKSPAGLPLLDRLDRLPAHHAPPDILQSDDGYPLISLARPACYVPN